MENLRVMDGEVVFAAEKVRKACTVANLELLHSTKLYELLQAVTAPYVVAAAPGPEPGIAPNVHLLPGPYRFYVDVAKNLVVRAEAPAAAIAAREHERRLQQLLIATQKLDPQTIEENRRFRMTDAQRAKLGRAKRETIAWILIGVPIVFGVLGYLHVSKEISKGRSPIDPISIMMALAILICLALLPSSIREQIRWNRGTKVDAVEGRLEVVEGILEKVYTMHKSSMSLSLKMNGESFSIDDQPQLFAVLVQGCRYRAYVARSSRRLVMIELLSG